MEVIREWQGDQVYDEVYLQEKLGKRESTEFLEKIKQGDNE